jgi:hypothetical protein
LRKKNGVRNEKATSRRPASSMASMTGRERRRSDSRLVLSDERGDLSDAFEELLNRRSALLGGDLILLRVSADRSARWSFGTGAVALRGDRS